MKYFIDLDNTLCQTIDGDYLNATPIYDRISKVNELKNSGHHITIWTARGSRSGIDYSDLTKQQLIEWDICHDELKLGKPDFDIMIDDKCECVDTFWRIPTTNSISKKLQSFIVPKGWGEEIMMNIVEKYYVFKKAKNFRCIIILLKKKRGILRLDNFYFIGSNLIPP